MVTDRFDFILESPSTNAVLLVEAKNISAPSPEWAARFARNLLEEVSAEAKFFLLLVLTNHVFLWKHRPTEGADLPDFTGRTEEVLQPYLQDISTPFKDLYAPSFELLIRSWLTDLSDGNLPPSVEAWVREAGLEQFEHGTLREEQPN